MKVKVIFKYFLVIISLIVLLVVNGCTTANPYTGESQVSSATIGTGIGAAGGAIAGQLIGGNTTATLIGASVGALAGGLVGHSMDRQAAELRQTLVGSGVQVVRIGSDIRLIMPGNITFTVDSADIKSNFFKTLNAVSIVLNKYRDTNIKVAGYASSTGSYEHNQVLSEQRAHSVGNYFISRGINPNRLMVVGYGKRYPIASNKTAEGRRQNQRVEITIHRV